MTIRKYLSTSQETTLTSAMNSSQTTMVVNSAAGLLGSITPAAGETFTVAIDPDTSLEEIVDVIAPSSPSSNTLTIVRSIDGTAPIPHSAGAKVRHMAVGRDFREANNHIENTTSAHGLTIANVVETTDTGTVSTAMLAANAVTTAKITDANVTAAKLASDSVTTAKILDANVTTAKIADSAVTSAKIADGTIVNADINSAAAIDKTKISGTAITAADTGTVTGTMIANNTIATGNVVDGAITSAKIADGTIVNADISATAGITLGKLATDPLARANHTGTQTASTISDFDTQVRTSRLNQMATPNAAVSMNSQKLSDVAAPVAGTDAANKTYVDTQVSNLVASAPGALDTLNELASALGNDANFSTTVTNSIATKVSKSGDTMTGDLTMSSGAKVTGLPTPTVSSDAVPLTYVTTLFGSTDSAATSAAAASTSAANAATSATASSNSATAAADSATAAAASATSAAASAASVDATATAATELRQYGAEGSILNNIPTRVHPAENLLRQAAYWIDSNHTSSSGQTVDNLGWTGNLLPTTLGSSTSADSNDPKFLDWTGTNYVYLPGVSGNYISVPDSNLLDVAGDIDIRVQVAMDDWTPAANTCLLAKWQSATQISYGLRVGTAGLLIFTWSADGSTVLSATSTVAPTITDGATLWVRATLDVDNGASGRDVKFYSSTDGTTWTQVGSTITSAGVTSVFNSTSIVEVGSRSTGTAELLAGKVFRAQIFNGIDGTKVLDVDTSVITSGAATSFFALSGQTVTINRSTSGRKTVAVVHPCWLFGTDDYMEVNNRYMSSGTYLYLPGISLNYASAPDSAALDITGDIDMRFKVALDDWTPTTNSAFAQKDANTTELSYRFVVLTTGLLRFSWSANGTTWNDISSTVAPTVTDGSTLWARATLDVDNGAGGNTVTFYTSTDGTNWTQLGSAVTTAGTTSIYSSNRPLILGASGTANANLMRGKFFRAQILDGIDGTVAFDANFESSITSLEQASFTESSANSATVTINRSGSAFRSAGITQAGYLYPGATNTFKASAVDYLNFGANDSFTVLGVVRNWATAPSGVVISRKGDLGTTAVGYALYNTSTLAAFRIAGPSGTSDVRSASISTGTLQSSVGIRNTVADTISLTYNSITSSIVDPTSSLSNFDAVRIGATPFGGYNDMELYAAAVFRRALTEGEIATINSYYAGRVGA